MKLSIVILIAVLLAGCSATNQIHEDNLYVTKRYIGDFVQLVPEKKVTNIITNQESFYIYGHPTLNIPIKSRCYVKYVAEKRVGSIQKYWVLYFTWDGTKDLYMLGQNMFTGEIY